MQIRMETIQILVLLAMVDVIKSALVMLTEDTHAVAEKDTLSQVKSVEVHSVFNCSMH